MKTEHTWMDNGELPMATNFKHPRPLQLEKNLSDRQEFSNTLIDIILKTFAEFILNIILNISLEIMFLYCNPNKYARILIYFFCG